MLMLLHVGGRVFAIKSVFWDTPKYKLFDDFDETGCHENHFHVLLVSFTFKQTTPPSLQKTKHEASIKNQNNFRISKTEQLSPKESVLLSNNLREELKTFFHNVSQCEKMQWQWKWGQHHLMLSNVILPIKDGGILFLSSLFLPCLKLKKCGFEAN